MPEARGDQDHHVVDVEALVRDLKVKLSDDLVLPPLSCIFKIPTILSRHNPDAYKPNAFSFGPFHHHDETLQRTEKIKYKYLLDLTSRLSDPNYNHNPIEPDTMLRTLTEEMNKVWKEARAHYAGPIAMNENKFVEVLVLDGCFVIELFRKQAYEKDLKDENDPIFSSYLFQFLLNDLILLENQIPWMVLYKLFNLTCTSVDDKHLVQLAIDFFGNIFSTTPPSIQPLFSPSHPSKHILDLLRNSLVLNSSMLEIRDNPKLDLCELDPMRSATSLEDSGIKFKMGTSRSILDIKFHQKEGVLEIPTLFIQEDITETLFRNLICLEKLCLNYRGIITSYAMLLNNLMQTTTDLKLLHDSGVIDNRIKHLEAAIRIFKDSHEEPGDTTFTSYYLGLAVEVEEFSRRRIDYYIRRWGAYKKVLKQTYFTHPWAAISTIGASVLLVLTFLQTIFTIIQK